MSRTGASKSNTPTERSELVATLTARLARMAVLVPYLLAAGCAVTPPPEFDAREAREKTMRLPHSGDQWFRDGQDLLAAKRERAANDGRATNVILFIGDGMSPDTSTIVVAGAMFPKAS